MSLAGNSGRLTQARHINRKRSATHSCQCVQYSRAALPIPVSVCSIQERRYPFLSVCAVFKSSATHSYQCVRHFPVSKQCYGCQSLGLFTCTQMLMHAIAHGGCTDTVRQSALKGDSGRKIPCRTGDSNPRQYCAWLFSRTLYQLSYPGSFTGSSCLFIWLTV